MSEIGTFIRGTGLRKADLHSEGIPAIHYGQIHTHYGIWTTESISFVEAGLAARLRHAQPGDVVLATTSEDDEAVGKATAWLGSTSAAISGDAFIYRHSLNPKFVSYFLSGQSFQQQKVRYLTGAKVRRISGDSLGKILIPVPPIEDQEELVAILDGFNALVNDLSSGLPAEIAARRKQYEFYRDKLLTFEGLPG